MIKLLIIWIIRLYQFLISPFFGSNCRFQPTCSEYTLQSFKQLPFKKAAITSFKRIIKCHPWGTFGYDPLIKKNNAKNI